MLDEMSYFWINELPHPRVALIIGLILVGIPALACLAALVQRMFGMQAATVRGFLRQQTTRRLPAAGNEGPPRA